MEAGRGKKHPSEAKNAMKESIYWKQFLIKVAQQPQKPFDGFNHIRAMTNGMSQQALRSLYRLERHLKL